MRSKDLRAKRAKLIADARDLSNSETYNPAEDEPKFDAMMAEADQLKAQIDRIELADTQFAATQEALREAGQRQHISADEARDRAELEDTTFMAWIRQGAAGLNEEQRAVFGRRFRAAQGTTPDTSGGYLVPTGFGGMIIEAQKAYGGMLTAAYVFDTDTGEQLPFPTDNDTSSMGERLGENATVSTGDVTFGQVTLNGYTYSSKLILVPNQLLRDSAFPLDPYLSRKMGTRLARRLNVDCTTGTGAKQPTGVITASALGYTAGGSTSSGETAAILSDDFIELEHSVDPAYRLNAKFMMSDTALKVTKKLKDGQGRPLWLSGLAVKEPDTINGYPYVINQDMDAPGASKKPVAFGDFNTYFIRRVGGVRLVRLVERYADVNQVGFLAFQDFDGQLMDAGTHPIKYLQNSAS